MNISTKNEPDGHKDGMVGTAFEATDVNL